MSLVDRSPCGKWFKGQKVLCVKPKLPLLKHDEIYIVDKVYPANGLLLLVGFGSNYFAWDRFKPVDDHPADMLTIHPVRAAEGLQTLINSRVRSPTKEELLQCLRDNKV